MGFTQTRKCRRASSQLEPRKKMLTHLWRILRLPQTVSEIVFAISCSVDDFCWTGGTVLFPQVR